MLGFLQRNSQREIEGLFTKEDMIEYMRTKDKNKKPKKNHLLVNEINENNKRLIGIKANKISQNFNLFEKVEIKREEIRNSNESIDLSNLDFSHLFLVKISFKGDFSGDRFIRTDFSGVYFNGADFTETAFIETDFTGTDFSGADFTLVNFTDAHFKGTNFTDAHFSGTRFIVADFRGADFRGADFTETDFTGTDFRGADFTNVKIQNVKLDLLKNSIENRKIEYESNLEEISNLCSKVEEKTLITLKEKQGIILYVDKIPMGILKSFGNPTFIAFQSIVNSSYPILIRGFVYSIYNSRISKILLDRRLFIEKIAKNKIIEKGDKDNINSDRLILNGLYKVEIPYLKVKLLRATTKTMFGDNIYTQILKFLRDLEKGNIEFDKSFKIEKGKLIEI